MSRYDYAAEVITVAWYDVFKTLPSDNERMFALAIALGESGFGQGWKPPCDTSHNWGAVQGGKPPCVEGEGCEYTDHHPDGTAYRWCYKVYPDDIAGAADMIRIAFRPNVRIAAEEGDIRGVSEAMYANKYYGGLGETDEDRIDWHEERLRKQVKDVAAHGWGVYPGERSRDWLDWVLVVGGLAGLGALAYQYRGKLGWSYGRV